MLGSENLSVNIRVREILKFDFASSSMFKVNIKLLDSFRKVPKT